MARTGDDLLTLGIETSCDDTAVAVLAGPARILSAACASQEEVHRLYGGVVPELASRRHLENILPLLDHALAGAGITLDEIGLVAVTRGPGLVGALLVGLAVAKTIAFARDLPLVGVNHLEAHLLANALEGEMVYPAVGLVVSGGHTDLFFLEADAPPRILGRTRDDAAGEVLDKVARELKLGYPGGAPLERLASRGRPEAFALPRARLAEGSLDFSFSGLKTAAMLRLRGLAEADYPDLAAGLQQALVDVIVEKTLAAAGATGVNQVYLGGGVAANGVLRRRLAEMGKEAGLTVRMPPPALCTDNAAMVAAAGYRAWRGGRLDDYALNADPELVAGNAADRGESPR